MNKHSSEEKKGQTNVMSREADASTSQKPFLKVKGETIEFSSLLNLYTEGQIKKITIHGN